MNWSLIIVAAITALLGGGLVALILVRGTSRKLGADTELSTASAAKEIAEGAKELVVDLRQRITDLREDVKALIATQELCDKRLTSAHELLADIKAEAADRLATANMTVQELARMRLVIEGLKEGRKQDREEVSVIREQINGDPPAVTP